MNRIGQPQPGLSATAGTRPRFVKTFALACVLVPAACRPAFPATEPEVSLDRRPMTKVFEVQRPVDNERLVLTTGEQLSGTVLNESFKLQTAYAELQLEKRVLTGLDLAREPGGSVLLVTVNSNHLAGFLKDSSIRFKSADGIEQLIRRERIARILFRLRNDELSGIPQGAWIFLKNGDRLSGQVLLENLPVRATNGTTIVKSGDLRALSNTNAPEPALLVLRDGQTLRGALALDDFPLQLDTGQKLSIYRDYVAFVDAGSMAGVVAPIPPQRLPEGPTNIDGMVWVPAGQFVMGSPKEETGRDTDEGPQTRVVFAQGFWLGKCEVTQAEYQRVMGANPSASASDPLRPVEKVSWFEAVEFCRKLTQMGEKDQTLPKGYIYRLPTEAEWEYACRAGSATRFSDTDDSSGSELAEYAWFTRNGDSITHPIGCKKPNRWGLHDMHGNVWEWCLDRWEEGLPGGSITNSPVAAKGSLRVARGGSWLYEPKACRCANRDDYSPWDKCSDIGFRVALAPLSAAEE